MIVEKTLFTAFPSRIRTEMATTETKARIKAYSTRVWPFLLRRYPDFFTCKTLQRQKVSASLISLRAGYRLKKPFLAGGEGGAGLIIAMRAGSRTFSIASS